MTIHVLKISDQYFLDIIANKKKFEIRKNDRSFKVKDKIDFCYEHGLRIRPNSRYVITYILKNVPEYGLMDGYVILSIEKDISNYFNE